MKFFVNEKLAQLTSIMTDAVVGTGECVINGRIEAFTMKRAGTDKKLAHELTEKYQAEIQVVESEFLKFAQFQNKYNNNNNNNNNTATTIGKKRSESIGTEGEGGEVAVRQSERQHSNNNSLFYNKRVRIETTTGSSSSGQHKNTTSGGRRRSNSVAIPIDSSLLPKSRKSCRSRSDSYDIKSILKPKSRKEFFDGTNSNSASSSILRSRSDSFVSSSSSAGPGGFIHSPLGDFHDSSTQRLMTDLILTLNASFPDYDFSNIRPSHFARLPSSKIAIQRTNEKLSELQHNTLNNDNRDRQGVNFFSQLWNAIDEVISINDSEVYSYVPPQKDDDDDPLGFLTQAAMDANTDDSDKNDHVNVPLWTLNFFFVNKSMKRIVLFTCAQTMGNEASPSADDDGPSDDVKETSSYDNYGRSNPGFQSSRENSALGNNDDDDDDDDDDQNWNFDVDTDAMGQPAPSTTVA